MHKYLIELMRYTENGVPTNDYTTDYADTPQGLADKVAKYNKMRYSTTDPDTGETKTGMKMYRVVAKQAVYQTIDDFNNFVKVNAVEYHA